MNIPITDVIVEDRARDDLGPIDELCESLLRYGLIHPIALDADKKLIAGGRRYTALTMLYKTRAKHMENDEVEASMLRFLRSGMLELGKHYTSKADADVDTLDEMELEENIQRKNFNWKEEVCAIHKIHSIKRKQAIKNKESWGIRQTGKLLGVSHASVQYATKLYRCLQDPTHPIQEAGSATDALHMLAKIKLDEARRHAVAKSISPIEQTKRPTRSGSEVSLDDIAEEFEVDVDDYESILQAGSHVATRDHSDEGGIVSDNIVIDLTNTVLLGKFEDVYHRIPQVDHILTDPPYGINMKNLEIGEGDGVRNIDLIESTHDEKENIATFEKWINICHSIMKDSGFMVMFCDMMHWRTLYDLATAVGFKCQRWPFVWCKTHVCMNQAADFNFTKNIEVALIARKGSATLVSPQGSSYIQASSLPTKKLLSGHPFVKPLELWQHLARAIAIEGETICDPFSGVGSMPRAVAELGYKFITCEVNEQCHTQQMDMLMNFYRERFDNVTFK